MSIATIGTPTPEFDFGDRIRKVRRSVVRASQAEMAEMIGVSQKVYAAWESSRTRPTDIVGIARRIEDLTGVAAGWLLGITSRPPGQPVGYASLAA